MAQKPKNPTRKKRSAAKKKPRAAKTAAPRAAPSNGARGRNAAYVLVIMGLVTALALLSNRFIFRNKAAPDTTIADRAPVEDERQAPVKPEKEAKENKVQPDVPETKQPVERPEIKEVKVYFVKLNEKNEKLYLAPVARKVEKNAILENAMKELIRGPSSMEKRKGFLTAVPNDLRINGIRIRNKTAEIDFNTAIERGATGSILLNRIDQIVYTATQFDNVTGVVIKINGRTRETLGGDGLSIGGPLNRR